MSVIAVAAAYLVGAVPVGLLVARAFGVGDIRQTGSGNIGATNVMRALGRVPAILTLVGDIVKGYVAVAVAARLTGGATGVIAAATVAAVVGNCWSVFLGFRGGKGVATGLGAYLRMVPWAVMPAALVFLIITASFRFVSLGSLTAAMCVPLGALMLRYPPAFVLASLVASGIVVVRHRANIARLLAGTESRVGERVRA
ncbi:MAG: glycerol-3-phosphate 1-O-acyltransferase PlsY [Candidatus Rokubacteria bacterium]|nr:glycerol-3-phosphate 1-O-acyltransferase PlsY [Candidatus Rokubacteria bacterium]